ncbi:PREDICTED: 27 kDa hemolymph protein-like [Ceratosolen solmsi marchali]|uniref:27 kDa hemolymph protein-like n=1 Tax=Ceratosolen solmsi marchali TaxID=326594 RepID=A0AAJ6YNQ1_9HYME|nr:PREDICTED: 27 kDa hemolymph protein-like [Ceratosolen solmsi marchali]
MCVTHSQTIPNVDEALSKVNEVLDIPQLKNLNISELPLDDAQNILKKKCEKNGGPGSYDIAKKAGVEVLGCIKDLVNFTILKEEMDKARPTGDLDEVFKKYCRKKPILKNCMADFTTAIEPCLEPEEKENKKIVHNITDKILNFICFKEGDRIALFIAAKGPECFQNKAKVITECANATSGSYSSKIPINPANGLAALSEIKNIPSLIFDNKTCRNMDKLQTCVVTALEGCDDPTPANLLDSIFNYIKKVTPCEKMLADAP